MMRLDRGAAPLEHARQSAGLALEMKPQRKLMQMDEHLDRQSSDRVHRDRREQRVPALLRQRHADAQQTIDDREDEHGSQERRRLQRLRQVMASSARP